MVVQLSMPEMYGDISRRSNAGLKDAMSGGGCDGCGNGALRRFLKRRRRAGDLGHFFGVALTGECDDALMNFLNGALNMGTSW